MRLRGTLTVCTRYGDFSENATHQANALKRLITTLLPHLFMSMLRLQQLPRLLRRLQGAPPAKDLLVFGHTNIDHIFSVSFLPKQGQTTEVLSKQTLFGGTGANIALNTASLGTTVSLSSYVGSDLPEGFRKRLAKTGVGLEHFFVKEGKTTPTCWIYNDGSQEQMLFMDQGAMKELDHFELPDIDFKDSDLVHIGTGKPAYYLKLLAKQQACKRVECQVPAEELLNKRPLIAFDPGQEIHYFYDNKNFPQMMRSADIFFGNRVEWDVALKLLKLRDPTDIDHVVPLAIRTLGEQGSELYMNGTISVIPAVKPKAREDTTGAGDAFRGGFYAALSRGANFEEAAFVGSAAASYSLQETGGQEHLPSFDKLLEFVES